MNDLHKTATDPRWGAENRNIKAEQIWHTLQNVAHFDLSAAHWLDIGCGSGGIAAHLAPRVQHMTGIDPESWARWDEFTHHNPNLSFIQASVDTLDLPPASFDVIICNQVYEHVPDPQALIARIHQLLKPNGLVYFAGPNLLFPIEPHVFWPFVHWLPRKFAIKFMKALGSKRSDDLDAYSAHYWQLQRWLSRHFKVCNALPALVNQVIPGLKSARLYGLLRHIPRAAIHTFTPLAPGFVFVLSKPHD